MVDNHYIELKCNSHAHAPQGSINDCLHNIIKVIASWAFITILFTCLETHRRQNTQWPLRTWLYRSITT